MLLLFCPELVVLDPVCIGFSIQSILFTRKVFFIQLCYKNSLDSR